MAREVSVPLPDEGERRQQVEALIVDLGLLPQHKSTQCLVDALAYCREDPGRMELITKFLYPDVAKKNHISICAVERNIRRAIGTVQNAKTPTYTQVFLHFPNKRVTNSEFFMVATNYLLGRRF